MAKIKYFVLMILMLNTACKESASKLTETELKSNALIKANEALAYCKAEKMNEDFCILIDLGIHSGRKRFFLYDFKTKAITQSFMVSHGCCNSIWGQDFSKEDAGFSNINDSHCSSVGKYKIGERGYSNWGINIKYLLHGLENTNNNALKRTIVFHSWEKVPDHEVYPGGTPEGWGCPAISNTSFKTIDPLLKKAKKPVLMWIFDSRN